MEGIAVVLFCMIVLYACVLISRHDEETCEEQFLKRWKHEHRKDR